MKSKGQDSSFKLQEKRMLEFKETECQSLEKTWNLTLKPQPVTVEYRMNYKMRAFWALRPWLYQRINP